MKAKNRKKKERDELMDKAVRIKCCFCDIKDTCTRRAGKEKDEKAGRMTYCTQTPNRPRSFKPKQEQSSWLK